MTQNLAEALSIIETQKKIIQSHLHKDAWEKALFSNPTLNPTDKLITWATTPEPIKMGLPFDYEQVEKQKIYIAGRAKEIGISADTFGTRFERCATQGKTFQYERRREPAEDGTPVLRVLVAPNPLLATPQEITIPKKGEGHGGKRTKKCTSCGSDNLIEKRQIICADCGVPQSETIHLVNLPENAIPQDDVWQNDELTDQGNQEEMNEPSGNLTNRDYPVTPLEVSEHSSPELEKEPIGKMTTGDFSLETWLANRIGEGQIIVATGDMDGVKYISKPKDYQPDLEKYLQGKRDYIYGSALLRNDGTTWQIEFDFDDKQPELDANHRAIQTDLANAGIASICSKRRPGRSHLAVVFSEPVDPRAAYAWVCDVCPQLATCEECYPIGEKRNNRISWPFYQRIGAKVTACPLVVMLSSAPGEAIESPGIVRDRAGVQYLLAQAVTPAALIPKLAQVEEVTQELHTPGEVLLDTSSPSRSVRLVSDDGIGKAVIADFNQDHSWEDIVSGEIRHNRFCATWRGEDKPSVVIDANGEYACDYGRVGNHPKKLDRFEAWCLINGKDKRNELKRLIAEYRELALQNSAPYGPPERPTICHDAKWRWNGERYVCEVCQDKRKRIAS